MSSSPIRFSVLLLVLGLSVASCANNPGAEGWFAPDPNLQESPEETTSSPTPSPTPSPAQLPKNFPSEIPRYPQAKFLDSQLKSPDSVMVTRWQSEDSAEAIATFYQKAFQENDWQILSPSPQTEETEETENTIIARQKDLKVTLSLPTPSETDPESTFELSYQWDSDPAQAEAETPTSPALPTPSGTGNEFSDLDPVSEPVQQYIDDLAALGVFPSQDKFEPDRAIARGEFARWLVTANNLIYANNPGKQIRLVSNPSQPAFGDVPKTHPSFAYIQGLAEAGLIPSPLNGNTSAVLFRPDGPLTRENLLLWKVPLDTRQGLPKASIDEVQKTWGFQDTAQIDPQALRSLLVDFQNGEQANVRRAFGFTTLFQPKKTVTRAEAATALWYFGYQGEGVTAQEALQLKSSNNAD